jgi:hypothetical protein
MLGSSWVAAQLAASQEGLRSIKLVCYVRIFTVLYLSASFLLEPACEFSEFVLTSECVMVPVPDSGNTEYISLKVSGFAVKQAFTYYLLYSSTVVYRWNICGSMVIGFRECLWISLIFSCASKGQTSVSDIRGLSHCFIITAALSVGNPWTVVITYSDRWHLWGLCFVVCALLNEAVSTVRGVASN